jgi:hypothetical protein
MSTSQSAAARLGRTLGCLAMAGLLAGCTVQSAATGTSRGAAGSHAPRAGAISHDAAATSTGRPRISIGAIPPAGGRQIIVLPLDAYEQVAALEQDTGLAAFWLLVQRCMQAKGFSYQIAPPSGGSQGALRAIEYQPIGITSRAQAQARGYGKPVETSVPSGRIGFSVFPLPLTFKALNRQSAAWANALLGGFAPGGTGARLGCLQTVQAQLDRGMSRLADPVPALAAEAAQRAQSDPRVLAVQRSWSRCMAAAGYSYQTPLQPATHHWPKKPTLAEITTATRDVLCKERVNLPNTTLTIEAAYQRAFISQNPAAFAHLQTAFRVLLRRAEILLSQTASTHPQAPGRVQPRARATSAARPGSGALAREPRRPLLRA